MLKLRTLPWRSAVFHWSANVPIVLGTAIGAAVLIGALFVGDSLRGSLREHASRQLGSFENVCVTARLITESIADRRPGAKFITPALVMPGSARFEPSDSDDRIPKRMGHVQIVGLRQEDAFWAHTSFPSTLTGAVLSSQVAERLDVRLGDTVALSVGKFSNVPRSSLLGKRGLSDAAQLIRVKVENILAPDDEMNEFSLTPTGADPNNIFLPLELLQNKVNVPGRVNALLSPFRYTTEAVNSALADNLTPEDLGLTLHIAPHPQTHPTQRRK